MTRYAAVWDTNTYRTTWTPPGHFAPHWHDFWAHEAAEHYADIKRALGCEHVDVIKLNTESDSTGGHQ